MKHEQIGSRCLPPCREAYENWYGEDEELLESENHFSRDVEIAERQLIKLIEDDFPQITMKTRNPPQKDKKQERFIKLIIPKTKNIVFMAFGVWRSNNKFTLEIWPFGNSKYKPLIDKLPVVLGWGPKNKYGLEIIGKPLSDIHYILNQCIEHLVPEDEP